jgi:hypothetical protein
MLVCFAHLTFRLAIDCPQVLEDVKEMWLEVPKTGLFDGLVVR